VSDAAREAELRRCCAQPDAFSSFELPNGLPTLLLRAPGTRAHLALYSRVGSRFETLENNGISHFLEHMLYRGTPALANAHAVNLAFEKRGGSLYAATQVDYGVFSVTTPRETLHDVTSVLADVLTRPVFRDIDVERNIVVEEILEDLDDEGNDVDADNASRKLIYPDHPLGFTITGTEAQVRAFSQEALQAHHRVHYTAANSVLVLAGDFEPAVAKTWTLPFEAIPRGSKVSSAAPTHSQEAPRFILIPNASSQIELRVCFRAIAESAPERAAMELLVRILDDGMSTRLYQRICDEQGLCYDVSANYDGYEDDGILDFAASVHADRCHRVVLELLNLMRELATVGPNDEELSDAKQRAFWNLRSLSDTPEDLANYYATGLLFGRQHSPDAHYRRLAAVGCDDIIKLSKLLCAPNRLNVVLVGGLNAKERSKIEKSVRDFRA
jgi:predicted Zn-dependent peptidase